MTCKEILVVSSAKDVVVVEVPGDVVFVELPVEKLDDPFSAAFGSFYDTTNQTGSTTARPVSINATTFAIGMSRSGVGRIVLDAIGTYKMTYSIQLMNTDNAIHYADIWLKYNDVNYPFSNTRFHVPARKNPSDQGYAVATVDFIGTSQNVGDFIELYWRTNSTQVTIPSLAAYDGVPATPGVILNLSQVA
jgi:hypothetical protein